MDKNRLFRFIFFGYMIIYAIMTSTFYKENNTAFDSKRTTMEMLQWYKTKVMPSVIGYLFVHWLGCKYVFTIIADKIIIASKYQGIIREKRISLVSTHTFKFLSFLVIVAMGIASMYQLEWIPKEFLFKSQNPGSTTLPWLIWQRDRFMHENLPIPVQTYFEFVTAYHLHSLIWHIFMAYGAFNFWEMLLHHFVTLSLISFCFITGHTSIGVLVTIVHDISDILSYAIKLAVNTASASLALSIYICLLISWIYYRLYALGYGVIYPIYLADYDVRVTQGKGYNEITVYVILLSTLFCLHVFWICLFIKIGLRFARKGVIHDSQETKRSEYSDPDTDSD